MVYCGCLFEEPILNYKGLFQEATGPVMTWPWVVIFVTGMELWDLVHKCGCSKIERMYAGDFLYTTKLYTVHMHDVHRVPVLSWAVVGYSLFSVIKSSAWKWKRGSTLSQSLFICKTLDGRKRHAYVAHSALRFPYLLFCQVC